MFIACLALVGCAAPEDVQLEPGDTVSSKVADTDSVAAAIAEWNTAVPTLGLVSSDSGRWVVKYADIPGPRTGEFCTSRREILIDPAAHSRAVFQTMLHEMGHAIGIHGHLPSGIMMEYFNANCIDALALAAVCEARPELCDGRERATCEE